MAIRIITGNPGSGKSYYAVHTLASEFCYKNKNSNVYLVKDGYTIISNIDNLQIDHISIDDALLKSGKSLEQFFTKEYQEKISEKYGKIIYFIDEAQRWFHRRFYNKDVFFYFQYHRHLGHDIFLMTQDIYLLPKEIHTLAEFEQRAVRRTLSFTGEFKYNIKSGNEIIQRKVLRPKKEIFSLYKSMVGKESIKLKNPLIPVFIAIILFTIASGYLFKRTFLSKSLFESKENKINQQHTLNSTTSQNRTNTTQPNNQIHDIYEQPASKNVTLSTIRLDGQILVVDPVTNELMPIHLLPYQYKIMRLAPTPRITAQIPHHLLPLQQEGESL